MLHCNYATLFMFVTVKILNMCTIFFQLYDRVFFLPKQPQKSESVLLVAYQMLRHYRRIKGNYRRTELIAKMFVEVLLVMGCQIHYLIPFTANKKYKKILDEKKRKLNVKYFKHISIILYGTQHSNFCMPYQHPCNVMTLHPNYCMSQQH